MKLKYFLFGFGAIFLYMLPYLIFGEDAYVTIHDFFDQNVPIMVDLKNNGLLTSISGVVPNMEGLDRSLFPYFTPFDIKMLCYYFLPTYWAVTTYTIVFKLLAFIGLFLLLDSYVFQKGNRWLSACLSIGFAIIPFYSEHALNEAGFPLIIYAFLNLYYNRNKVWSYAIIFIYSFNTTLAYGGFFFLVLLALILLYDVIVCKNKLSINVVYGAGFMCLVYLFANWGTISSLFFSESFVSHRTEWVYTNTLLDDVKGFLILLFRCQNDVGRLLAGPVLVVFIIFWAVYRNKYKILNAVGMLALLIILGIIVGTFLKRTGIQIFITIQFDRFYFFYPGLVFLFLASICFVLTKEGYKKFIPFVGLYALLCGPMFDTEWRLNTGITKLYCPNYKQLYDVSLFSSIQKDLGVFPDYKTKVVSVGLYPSVAEVNGFYTIDAYRVNYPLEFKYKFRGVIEEELAKDEELRKYYDEWGSRCYVFSSEIGRNYLNGKEDKVVLKNLEINTNKLKELGCEYIISAVDISNYEDLNLTYVNEYTTPESFYDIRIYKIK